MAKGPRAKAIVDKRLRPSSGLTRGWEKVADRPDEGTLFPHAIPVKGEGRKFSWLADKVICQARKELARI
jgi:hypothetical protein